MKIKGKLLQGKVTLLLVPSHKYENVVMDVAKELEEHKVCYVNLSRTHGAHTKNLKANGINARGTTYINAISEATTARVAVGQQPNGHYSVSSPGAFTEISVQVSKVLKKNCEYLVLDQLTNLVGYQDKTKVIKLVSNIAKQARQNGAKAVFYALDSEEHQDMIKECGACVDNVIRIENVKAGRV
ncbi:Uncharacterised protein [Candidatus Gugararchaeum adminiculabundum]|nr:Uncharacterised protein [Candidatus Gugararchaeum adminiculabundum]